MAVRAVRRSALVLGGGFAGTAVARMLGRGVTIVSPIPDLVYTPLLPEVASGELRLKHVSTPLRIVCPHAEVLAGSAVSLDTGRRVANVRGPAGDEIEVGYTHLVVAVGAVPRLPPVPGLAEHALAAKTAEDFVRLRAHVLEQLAAAANETDEARRRARLTFVFVGGGYAGVETLAELQRLVQEAVRTHRVLRSAGQRWLLADVAPQILADIPGRLGAYASRALERRAVEIRTGATLSSLTAGEAVLVTGERIPTHTLVWTAGVRPAPVVEQLGLPLDARGRIVVTPTLAVEGVEHVWSAGDCAAVPNEATSGELDPPTSQHARQQGHRIGRNIRAVRAGRAPAAYRYATLGQVATLGRFQGTADLLGVPLTGIAGWAAARAVHALQLPTAIQRVGVVTDWTLSLAHRRNTSA